MNNYYEQKLQTHLVIKQIWRSSILKFGIACDKLPPSKYSIIIFFSHCYFLFKLKLIINK